MLKSNSGSAVLTSLDSLPFTISPSTSFLRLNANEIGKSSVEFAAWFQRQDRHATVRIEFVRCISARMLAFGGESGHGIGVVPDSRWLVEVNLHQRLHYPASPDNFKDMKHFYFQGHDVSVEVLAEGLVWSELGGRS